MPLPAKFLAACLVINILISGIEFAVQSPEASYVTLIVRILLLIGFLKGSEGVRMLLQIGATFTVVAGVIVLLAVAPHISMTVPGAIIAVAIGLPIIIGMYMLWALRHPAVQRWMLNRTLGGALDRADS